MERLFDVKGRDAASAIALIAADVDAGGQAAAEVSDRSSGGSRAAFWPGPLTIVVPAARGMAAALTPATGRVGVRVPAHRVARALAAAFGCVHHRDERESDRAGRRR